MSSFTDGRVGQPIIGNAKSCKILEKSVAALRKEIFGAHQSCGLTASASHLCLAGHTFIWNEARSRPDSATVERVVRLPSPPVSEQRFNLSYLKLPQFLVG
jgi:hypothetical protein